ncbi:hypothetical protein [Kitasatospora sp. NPDC001175]|uniref:hypothetical protein n=1 Tax=Kitasatospora sp. NPDC001175 TaxID=3157103 RepID=UPI003D0508F6
MRIQRVSDIPHGGLAAVIRKPGTPVLVLLNADLVTEDQAEQLSQRLRSDPDFLAALGGADV